MPAIANTYAPPRALTRFIRPLTRAGHVTADPSRFGTSIATESLTPYPETVEGFERRVTLWTRRPGVSLALDGGSIKTTLIVLALLLAMLVATRLCHTGVLWTEEGLPLAAAVQMAHGKALYRDVWFDKPPLTAAVYLLWGAHTGLALRIAGALWVFAGCLLVYRFASELWGRREAMTAAWALGLFLTFDFHAAVIPLAADLLMVVPHIAAVWLAWRGRPFASGLAAGVAVLFNAKGVFVLAACALFAPRSLPLLAAGFAAPHLAAAAWFAASGALDAYYEQVWKWGGLYAANTFIEQPVLHGVRRTAGWAGFHLALLVPAVWFWIRDRSPQRRRFALWAVLSIAAVATGARFFPRYYFQLLPVLVLAAARGFWMLGPARAVAIFLLLVPATRFGPRYALLAYDLFAGRPHEWRDVSIDRDSQDAAALIKRISRDGDTLFVWGFRPELFAYTRLPSASRFLESQPLTGVFADRHLTHSEPVDVERARQNRKELAASRPALLADGLSLYNPALSMHRYEEFRDWLADYEVAGRTLRIIVYRRRSSSTAPHRDGDFPQTSLFPSSP